MTDPGPMPSSNSSVKVDPSTGQFIDPLFAVIIAAALAETVVAWVKVKTPPDLFTAVIFVVGFVNLLLSWFGYHKSVLKRPIKGSLRFIVTVVLLPLYLLTIIVTDPEGYRYNILVYGFTFFLWSLWDYLKYIEHKASASFWKIQRRYPNLLAYLTTAYVFIAHYFARDYPTHSLVVHANEIALALIASSIIFLRVANAMRDPKHPAGQIRSAIRSNMLGSAD